MNETPSTNQFRFLWVTLVFEKKEKAWYRFSIIALTMAVTLAIVYMMRAWAMPAMIAGQYFTFKVGVGG